MKPELPWHSRFDLLGVTFLLFLAAALGALPAIEGSGRDLDYLGNLSRFAAQFFPPDWSISRPYPCWLARDCTNRLGFHSIGHLSILYYFPWSIP